jgi:hypothetical protein
VEFNQGRKGSKREEDISRKSSGQGRPLIPGCFSSGLSFNKYKNNEKWVRAWRVLILMNGSQWVS